MQKDANVEQPNRSGKNLIFSIAFKHRKYDIATKHFLEKKVDCECFYNTGLSFVLTRVVHICFVEQKGKIANSLNVPF